MRVEKLYLFFGKPIWKRPAGRDRVRDRLDPARRLRQDHRHEPGGGAASGGRPARLLREAGLEALLRDPRRARRERRRRLPDPVRHRVRDRGGAGHRGRARSSPTAPPTASSSAATRSSRSTAYRRRRTRRSRRRLRRRRSPRTSAEASRPTAAVPRPRRRIVVERDGERWRSTCAPYYDEEVERTRLGFAFEGADFQPLNPVGPGGRGHRARPDVARDLRDRARPSPSSSRPRSARSSAAIVGAVETTRQAIQFDAEIALRVIALVSLSLALINLLPILPLDGGHVFWSLVEKVRGQARLAADDGAGERGRLHADPDHLRDRVHERPRPVLQRRLRPALSSTRSRSAAIVSSGTNS